MDEFTQILKNEFVKSQQRELDYCHELINQLNKKVNILICGLKDVRTRIANHPAYGELTEEEENSIGGDAAELSYIVRMIDKTLLSN